MEESFAKFLETTAPSGSLERVGRGDVQVRWYACGGAHPGHVRGTSPTGGKAVARTFKFPLCNGGRRPKPGDTPIPRNWDRKDQNWRGGRYDQTRFETLRTEPVFDRLQRRQPQDKPLLSLNYSECLVFSVVVPQICRLKWRQIRAPFWSFGGQSRNAANFGVRAEARTVEVGQVCSTLRKERTCQPDLVRACSVRPGTLRALQQPLALVVASWSRLSGTRLGYIAFSV